MSKKKNVSTCKAILDTESIETVYQLYKFIALLN